MGSRAVLTFVLAACALAIATSQAAAQTFTNPTAISVANTAPNNGSIYPSSVVVSGVAGPISDVNVITNQFSHTFPADVGIVLVGPQGRALLLEQYTGTTAISNVTTTFDDQAANGLPATGAWSTGSYRPTTFGIQDTFPAPGPGMDYATPGPAGGAIATLDGTFNNTNPNGEWRLFDRDYVTGEGGSIAGGWTLQITSTPDTTAPETAISAGPEGPIASSTAAFAFSATEESTFQCQLDAGGFTACASPASFTSLADGVHSMEVRATDAYGNVDPTPASRTFTVDTTPPATTIDSGPSGTVNSANASFAFSANEASTFLCKLDDQPFTACTSPQNYSGLADGIHTFSLRAVDAAGNIDLTGAGRAFTIQTANQPDITDPVAKITKPKPRKGKKTAVVKFSASDDGTARAALKFTCILDGGAAKGCTSPTTYKHLKVGSHSVTVLATDAAGNTSAPASTSFKIKA